MKYTSINIQGNLISEDILQKVEQGEASGQLARDFGFEPGTNLRGEIEYAWSRIKLDWKHFNEKSQNLPASDPYGTSLARRWMKGFFTTLGFYLRDQKTSLQGDNNQTYSISHTVESLDNLPVHIVGFYDPNHPLRNTLDSRSSGGTSRLSPHATVQEYLNVTEYLYSLVTNGLTLRLVRDSGRLVKLTYIEFDLRRLLEEDKYSEFTVIYRLLHASRFPRNKQEAEQCQLEKYYQDSIETGNRIRDGLSKAVELSLVALGNGFLQHAQNTELRDKLINGQLTPVNYYRQLRRLIYRLLFLMVTEERDLIYDPDNHDAGILHKKGIYLDFYSISRLRKLSENHYLYESQFTDLWQGIVSTFRLFEATGKGHKLGIQPLDGDLFNGYAIPDIESSVISNQLLLECIRNLNEFSDVKNNLVSINYRALDVEELGSVYEGLLDLHPVIEGLPVRMDEGNIEVNASSLNFTFHAGTDRKTTGSYYTRPDLVNELIKSALIPVIEERLSAARKKSPAEGGNLEEALLSIKVCDPAAGSGHMLLAAARTIAWYLARVRSGEENPAPSVYRSCLRETIQQCVYGVDMNPDAVELCKLALWLESHNSGKPLSFLDHKIRCGNSLVGVTDLEVLGKGIPSEAYNPVTGDDRVTCTEVKKDNQRYLKFLEGRKDIGFQQKMHFEATKSPTFYSQDYEQIANIKQDDLESVQRIKSKYEHLRSAPDWYNEWTACNIWTSAFFWNYSERNRLAAPTSERLQQFLTNHAAAYAPMVGKANGLSMDHRFFHWPLEFPDVFEQGGFDVMLGNPPWERIKLQQQEFFGTLDTAIANAPNAASRNKLIQALPINNPLLFAEYQQAMHKADASGKFLRDSGRYILTAVGDINTYSVFAEFFSNNINKRGKAGFIVPTGIATDDSNKAFFGFLIEENRLHSLFDFENKEAIFPSVHRSYKFCLLTISGSEILKNKARFGFFLTRIEHLQDKLRVFSLSKEDFLRLNPNTKTCPVFRTSIDAELTTKIYKQIPVLINEQTGENPWGVSFMRMFDMSNDSHLFRTRVQLEVEGFRLWGNKMKNGDEVWLPLYEAKYTWQYDHRYETHDTNIPINIFDSNSIIYPRYWISASEVKVIQNYLLIQRAIADMGNERRMIFSIIPKAGIGNSGLVNNLDSNSAIDLCLYSTVTNSIIVDYLIRVKAQNPNLNQFVLKQIAIIGKEKIEQSVLVKALELFYSSWDIIALADDIWKEADEELKAAITRQWEENQAATGGHTWAPPDWCEIDKEGCPLPPFKWDEDRRAVLKAELDAIYAKLYGLTTEELRYILDPQDVYGPDFPGETFRVLKEKEIRLYGEYRTRRLVLEAWERFG